MDVWHRLAKCTFEGTFVTITWYRQPGVEVYSFACFLPSYSGFQAAEDTPEIIPSKVIIIIPYGRINSRMTSYLKIFATGRTNLKIFPAGVSTAAWNPRIGLVSIPSYLNIMILETFWKLARHSRCSRWRSHPSRWRQRTRSDAPRVPSRVPWGRIPKSVWKPNQ